MVGAVILLEVDFIRWKEGIRIEVSLATCQLFVRLSAVIAWVPRVKNNGLMSAPSTSRLSLLEPAVLSSNFFNGWGSRTSVRRN